MKVVATRRPPISLSVRGGRGIRRGMRPSLLAVAIAVSAIFRAAPRYCTVPSRCLRDFAAPQQRAGSRLNVLIEA